MVLHCETVTGKTQENSSKVHLGHFRSSLSTCLNFTEGFFPLQIPQCTGRKKKRDVGLPTIKLKSIFQLHYLSWLLIHIFARALVGSWSHFAAVLHTQTHFKLPWKHPLPHLDTFVCQICHLPGKGWVCEILHCSGAALEPELAQTYTTISTCTTIRTTQKQSENTESFMRCLGSLVTSQIIIPPYLLEKFGRKRRDCWKLAFKSGFPWERWSCSEVCGITW